MIDALTKLLANGETAVALAFFVVLILIILCATLYNIIEVIVMRPPRKK